MIHMLITITRAERADFIASHTEGPSAYLARAVASFGNFATLTLHTGDNRLVRRIARAKARRA
jgi:hypothetical protein